MVGKFLNLDDDTGSNRAPRLDTGIGAGLKRKAKPKRDRADAKAVARAGEAHGFTRATQPQPAPAQSKKPKLEPEKPRRGRPPLNEQMTYWRIYVAPELRDELNALRDKEGRRLNDVLRDMLDTYKKLK